jgi:malonyl-CoA O-methyltransferase
MSGAKRPLHSGPPLLDRRAIRDHFERASVTYDESAVLAGRLREQLIGRLDWIAFVPDAVLDLGCGTGWGASALRSRWPRARVVAVDASPGMLRETARRDGAARIERLCAEAEAIPLPDASMDLVFSNLMLPWCEDVDAVFAEVARILKPRGLFTFTSFGPDTLVELRAAWREADDAERVQAFTDMHDLGDSLVRAGLAEPVLDVSRYTLTYPQVGALMRDLRAIGAQNAAAARPRGLTGRGRLQAMAGAYESFRTQGLLPATHEVVFGQAWGAVPSARPRRGEPFAIPVGSIGRREPPE